MAQSNTKQEEFWAGTFGTAYIDRNQHEPDELNALYTTRYGVSRTELNKRYLGRPDPSARVLEVGCNIGNQLFRLHEDGWSGQLYGVEINRHAIDWAHRNRPELDIIYGSALEIPFRNQWFDVITISGLLIHISPSDLRNVLSEVVRVMKPRGRYMGLEYWAPTLTEVPYRGQTNCLWKCDFAAALIREDDRLCLLSEEELAYKDGSGLIDQVFLLEKVST